MSREVGEQLLLCLPDSSARHLLMVGWVCIIGELKEIAKSQGWTSPASVKPKKLPDKSIDFSADGLEDMIKKQKH